MTPPKKNRPWAVAGSLYIAFPGRDANPELSPTSPESKENVIDASHRFSALPPRGGLARLCLVPHRPAPPVVVRISVADGRSPIGRSRAFEIHWRDLAQLLRLAERAEAAK
jgi:hypothetical protein